MDREKKVYPEDQDLTEADRTILRLYEKSVESIEWDESDAAILAYAHSIHAKSEGDPLESGSIESTAKTDEIASTEESLDEIRSGDVVAFKPRQRSASGRAFYRSPLAGLSIAASLMIGVFAGQGLTPYVNLGVAPDYDKIIEENKQLTSGISRTRSIRIRDRETPDGSAPSAAVDSGLNRIGTILSGFNCANLTMTLLREGEVRVSGHLSSPGDLYLLRSNLAKIPQLGRVVEDIRIYGWPTCEALQVLGKGTIVGGGAGGGPEVRPFDHGPVYVGGESLVVEARGPEQYESYLYVDFVQNDGNVVHLLPFDQRMENKVKPDQKILLGNADIQYDLAPPFGTELLVIIASPVPIFEEPRAESEPARDYFRALEQALARLAAEGHGDKVMSAYRVLTTKAE